MHIPYVRLYADDAGESHFEDRLLELEARDFSPPAPPLLLSSLLPGSGLRFFVSEPGWFGDWHPAPQRQWMVRLSGATTLEVSDGERRSLPIGTILLLEDTGGKGHRTRNDGPGTALVLVVPCPEAG